MSDYGKEASMIPRALGKQAKQLAQWFPVVSITGPRQSGKSTLAKITPEILRKLVEGLR